MICLTRILLVATRAACSASPGIAAEAVQPARVFIFAGQSNMVGSDSKVADLRRYPPFAGLEDPPPAVRFSSNIGRENKLRSDGERIAGSFHERTGAAPK